VLYVPDVFGIWQNAKLIADQLAANGYRTLIADVLNGDALESMPKGFDIMKWVTEGSDGKNPHTKEAIDPIIEASIKELQSQGAKKIGAVGYCFGAKVRFALTNSQPNA
jgi:dienelactone hydrolase